MLDKLQMDILRKGVNFGVFILFLIVAPLVLGYYVLGLNHWDISMPMIYGHGDDIWQMTLTKALSDTGWVLTNPYLGAPEIASWHHNAAAQTSALHSIILLGLSNFIHDPVALQQFYFLLNFSMIAITSYYACRLLGTARLLAICVAFLFAFTTFRINYLIYSFIPNYFTVPLALVTIIWVFQGKFDPIVLTPQKTYATNSFISLVKDKKFLLGAAFILLTAISDGYYAFFTLLMLAFSTICRLLIVGWKKPTLLLPATIYTALLLAAAIAIQLPLYSYKKEHYSEFFPMGKEDPSLIKHSFEAEVYSTSLKLLVAPIPQHRLSFLGKIGADIINSNTAARKYEAVAGVSLGALGSALLILAFITLSIPQLKRRYFKEKEVLTPPLTDALLPLILFVFLCSIYGGIGTLIALVFPTIRAYDRFAIFLVFLLLLLGTRLVMPLIQSSITSVKLISSALIISITLLALFDQIPATSNSRNDSSAIQFKAERNFVQQLEAAVPANSMVYQYPYSQYLRDSPYYGWGAFSHVRLYLNSHSLHWSNGGAKNSPADDWNYRLSKLPLTKLITEIEALGFKSIVIDRTVVKDQEYSALHDLLIKMNYTLVEDAPSNFAYAILHEAGYRINYDKTYTNIQSIDLTSKNAANNKNFPELINADRMREFISNYSADLPSNISNKDHPTLFVDGSVLVKGSGEFPITPLSDAKGELTCQIVPDSLITGAKSLTLTLKNKSSFNWTLRTGSFPLSIGYHVEDSNGITTQWDNGYRVPLTGVLKPDESKTATIPYQSIQLPGDKPITHTQRLRFALVQDANAWFPDVNCVVQNN